MVYGGFSAERAVSISSKDDIYQALTSKGYEVIEHDLTDIWNFLQVLKEEKPDVVFNGLYGNWGEDGEIQAFLDMLQIPYTHSGLYASAAGMNKYLTLLIAQSLGIKTAAAEKTDIATYLQKGSAIPYPHVVKPVSDGSSVGVYIIKKPTDTAKIKLSEYKDEILVERYIPGQELTVMCLLNKAYVVTELRAKNEFYDYNAKYTSGLTEHILPAEIPEDVAEKAKDYAVRLHMALGCNTLSRCDFRYNPDDGVVLLEINTNPGLTKLSLVPEQAKYAGISFADLCDILIKNATCRKR